MPQQPAVTLTDEERRTLETFVHRGKANVRTLTRARILLKSAEGWSTAALAEAFDVCEATVTNVRRRFAQGGLKAVLHDQVQQHRRGGLRYQSWAVGPWFGHGVIHISGGKNPGCW